MEEIKEALATIREEWIFFKYHQGGIDIFEKESRAVICVTSPTEDNGYFDGSIIAKFPTWLAAQQTTIDQQAKEIERLKKDNSSFMSNCRAAMADAKQKNSSLVVAVTALEKIVRLVGSDSIQVAAAMAIEAHNALETIKGRNEQGMTEDGNWSTKVTSTIQALESFKTAYSQLNEVWGADDVINDLVAIDIYPFAKSFDELGVVEWIDATVRELVEKNLSHYVENFKGGDKE